MNCRLLCISVIFAFLGSACSSRQPEQRCFPFDDLSVGDLAFRCGRGVFSRVVTIAEADGLYSHVGVVVRDNGEWKIAHAVPDELEFAGDFERVKLEKLDQFFSVERASKACLVHTGLKDSLLIAGLNVNAIRAARDSVQFDNDYTLEDSSKVYCTEFVWRLYKSLGIDLSEGRRKYINFLGIKGDMLLPEHILAYSENFQYYCF